MSEKKDELTILAATEEAALAVRSNEEGDHLTVLRPMEEGKPLTTEVLDIKRKEEGCPHRYDVKVIYKPDHPGPSRANSKAYRSNYDSIFRNAERPDDEMLN